MRAPPLTASLLLVAAGCGDVTTLSPPDAGSSDGGADAAPERGTVSLELAGLFGSQEPLPGSTVLILMPDGTVIGEDVTDDDGRASVDDVPPGAVMIIFPTLPPGGDGGLTLAIFDVGPGDEIVFGNAELEQGGNLGQMQVQLPGVKDPAPIYHASNGCHHTSNDMPTVPLAFYEECVDDGNSDVLAWVAQSGDIAGFLDANRPFSADMPMDLSALSWESPATLDVALTGIPAEVRELGFAAAQMNGPLEYGELIDELHDTLGTELELAVKVPSSFGDSTLVSLEFGPNQNTLGQQLIQHRAEGDLEWDLSEELLPWYSGGVYSVPERRISWARTSGREPDVHFIILSWANEGEKAGSVWYTMSPPGWEEIVLPPLPEEWADREPTDPAAASVQIYAVEMSGVEGYEAARQLGFGLIGEDVLAPTGPGSTWRLSLGLGSGF